MKQRKNSWICLLGLMGLALLLSNSCSKSDDNSTPQAPVFTVTADSVILQSGGEGLQFFGKCTNEDVKMTNVTVTSPISHQSLTYALNGNSYLKNASIPLQDNSTAYNKELGTWNFTFVGNRTADNVSFSVTSILLINVK